MKRVLFLGEGDLSGPARYLASVLTWAKIPFDHRPDKAKIPKVWRTPHRYGTIILSDYRYRSFTPCSRAWLTEEVTQHGTGFLMIGGWASFTGLVGGYAGTAVERLLPVTCVRRDDRVNCVSGSLLANAQGETLSGFPMVCGYHRVISKPFTKIILMLRDVQIAGARLALGKPHPLLVRGVAGKGKTAAFLTDCAPHWAGGLVDWGRRRVTVRIKTGISMEVGDRYLKFFANLVHSLMPK